MSKNIRMCQAKSCPHTNRNSKISFFGFPTGNQKRLEKWLSNIEMKSNSNKLKYLCADHFDLSSFTNTFRNRLLPDSVPVFQNTGMLPVNIKKVSVVAQADSGPENYQELEGDSASVEDTSDPDWASSQNLEHDSFNGKRKRHKDKVTTNTVKNSKTSSINKDVERIEDIEDETPTSSSDSLTSSSDSEEIPVAVPIKSKKGTPTTTTSKDAHMRTIQSEDSFSTATTSKKIKTTANSENIPSIAVKSGDKFLDANNLDSVQDNNLRIIHGGAVQSSFLNSCSQPNSSNSSEQVYSVTHAEAFHATETLLHYIMNQDDVNNTDINFILNFAQRIKNRLSIKDSS